MIKHLLLLLPLTFAGVLAQAQPAQAASQLPPQARLAIIGDSITEQKLYSKYIETYLLVCAGRPDIHCFQFGWSGERADGFANRAENDLSVFSPTVATLCYGMNDGGYTAYTPAIGKTYETNMRNVVDKLTKLGVKNIVVGSPGAVDTTFFTRIDPQVYNASLANFRDIDRKLAEEKKLAFANVHDTMIDAMAKGKAALGKDYDVCGRDGVHPGANGQLLMAYAFLKGLGLDGNIGEITLDLKGSATASEGHKITDGQGNKITLESTKWPFILEGDDKSSGGTRSITAFCNFNQDLNRLTLKVKNLDSAKAKVTWGTVSKEFTREQLTQGINLATEFTVTPFDAPFKSFMNAVGTKQAFETPMIKGIVTQLRSFTNEIKSDAEFASALDVVKKKLVERQSKLDAEQRTHLKPVQHTLQVDAL